MKTLKRIIKGESGQAFVMALIVMCVGSLLIGAFLNYVSTSLIATQTTEKLTMAQYSADAGIEDAIWNIVYGDFTKTELVDPGDSVSYSLKETINGINPDITVTRLDSSIASDDFESGGFSGGLGWLSAWTTQHNVNITPSGNPFKGKYHLRMRGAGVSARRAADLSGQSGLRLEFWSKTDFNGKDDEAYCRISPDGINWTTVRTWGSSDNDNTYYFNDIDLSSYDTSSEFWIDFSSGMDSNADYLYIDNLEVTGYSGASVSPDAVAYQIESSASNKKITADILVDDTKVAILAWQYE